MLVLAAIPMATVNVLGEVRARYQQQQAVKAAAEARREARLEKWRAEAGQGQEAREKAHPPKASQASYQDPASLGRLTAAAILARGGACSSTAECWAAYNEYTADTTSGPPALDPGDLGGAATFVNACKQALAEAGLSLQQEGGRLQVAERMEPRRRACAVCAPPPSNRGPNAAPQRTGGSP